MSQNSNSKWIREAVPKQLKTLSNELIQTLGILQMSIQSNNWYANPTEIQVVTDGNRSLLSRYLFPALGLSIQQSNSPNTVNQVEQEYCPIKKQIATDILIKLPELVSQNYIQFAQNFINIIPHHIKEVGVFL